MTKDEAIEFTIKKLKHCRDVSRGRGLKNWEKEALYHLETSMGVSVPLPYHIWAKTAKDGVGYWWREYETYVNGFNK